LQCISPAMHQLSKLLLLIQERQNCGASVPSDRLKASIFPPLEMGGGGELSLWDGIHSDIGKEMAFEVCG